MVQLVPLLHNRLVMVAKPVSRAAVQTLPSVANALIHAMGRSSVFRDPVLRWELRVSRRPLRCHALCIFLFLRNWRRRPAIYHREKEVDEKSAGSCDRSRSGTISFYQVERGSTPSVASSTTCNDSRKWSTGGFYCLPFAPEPGNSQNQKCI